MKKLLVVLSLSLVFFLPSFASDEKDKNIPWYLSSPGHYSYSAYPPSLFDPNYLDKHNRWQEYLERSIYGFQRSAIVVPRPPSFGESFLRGFSKGMSRGVDDYYRARQQRRDIKTTMALIKLKWASEGYRSKPKYSQPHEYRNEYKMSPQEERANRDRIKELDRIIKLKKERANLDKLFREAGWLDKDRIEYLDKYYPLPEEERTLVEKERQNDLEKFLIPPIPEGWILGWQYKVKKLNEYLKSRGLPPVPTNVDVNQVYDGDWIIYWDGEKWARKKKE